MLGRKTLTIATLAVSAACVAPAQAATPTDACDGLTTALSTDGVTSYTINGVLCTGTYAIYKDFTITGVNGGGFQRAGIAKGASTRSLRIDNGRDVTLTDLAFTGAELAPRGQATGPGGVSYVNLGRSSGLGTLTVDGSTFTGIRNGDGPVGGGLDATLGKDGAIGHADLHVTDSTFTDNAAGLYGGGVAVRVPTVPYQAPSGDPSVEISGATFDGNAVGPGAETESAGGGLFIEPFVPRRVQASRAARATQDVDVELHDNDYVGNVVLSGEGTQRGSGGGAEFRGVVVASERERYLDNEVESFDGRSSRGGGLTVLTVRVDDPGNEVRPRAYASFTAVNDAIAGNAVGAGGYGAGIYAGNDNTCGDSRARANASNCGTTVDLTHTTISGNTGGPGASGAGIGLDEGEVLSVDRSIVWGNTNESGGINRARAEAVTPEISGGFYDVTRSDFCDTRVSYRAPDEQGNICADPLLGDPTGAKGPADVHQTASSPTIDAVGVLPEQAQGRNTGLVVGQDFDRPADARPLGKAADMGADEFKANAVPADPTPTPTATPTPTPTPAAAVPPAPSIQVLPEVDSNQCGSKRFFRIVLRKKKGRVYRSARIVVNGKKVKVTTSRDKRPTTRIDLRKFGYQTIRIQITAKLANGKTLKGKRTYHPCRPSLDDGVPPKL